MRTSERVILYHVAPRSARSVIEQEGLRADLQKWPESRAGVYFWNDPEWAEEWRQYVENDGSPDSQPHDIWAVHDTDHVPDPLVADGESFVGFIPIKHSRYSPNPVAPRHLRMHAEGFWCRQVSSGDAAGAEADLHQFSPCQYSLDPRIRSIQESWGQEGGEAAFIPHEDSPWVQHRLALQEANSFNPIHAELDVSVGQPCGEI